MPDRHFPVRPNLDQLKHQAKDLLRAVRAGDAAAIAEFQRNHPEVVAPVAIQLADAQLALARATASRAGRDSSRRAVLSTPSGATTSTRSDRWCGKTRGSSTRTREA